MATSEGANTNQASGDTPTLAPTRDLSEIALYSYTALCSYSLGKLYAGSSCDKELVEKWTTKLAEQNGHGDLSKQTMLAMATGEVDLPNADPFVDAIVSDDFVVQHGSIIIPENLMTVSLKEDLQKDGCYDARLRTLIKYVCLLLRVDWATMEKFEESIVEVLQEEEHEPTEEEMKEQKTKTKKRKIKRYLMISAAAVGGGALLGLTGGLAAPLIAAGAGAVIGGAGAAALGSVAGVAIIGSLFGVAGVGLGGYKMRKRVGGVEEFEFEPLSESRQLHITIGVSGWITEKMPDVKSAWLGLANSKEQYVLKFETKYLMELGKALEYLMGIAIKAATQEALKYTVLSGLLTAIAWPAALLSASSVIDNPWNVCTHRAVNVGRQLADVLLSRQQGKRPVTLVGFSLGARVIFYCLQEMAKRKNCEGIVEDVVLLGTPVTGNPKEWEPLARVVSGKIINGYCRGDWLLKFLYRTASIQFSVAGLKAVPWIDRRMHNIDLSDVVQGHLDYMNKVDEILNVVGIKTKDHPPVGQTAESLREWVSINKSISEHDQLSDSAATPPSGGENTKRVPSASSAPTHQEQQETELTAPCVEVPASGMEAPTSGVEAPTSGVQAPTSGMEAPTSGMEAATTGVEVEELSQISHELEKVDLHRAVPGPGDGEVDNAGDQTGLPLMRSDVCLEKVQFCASGCSGQKSDDISVPLVTSSSLPLSNQSRETTAGHSDILDNGQHEYSRDDELEAENGMQDDEDDTCLVKTRPENGSVSLEKKISMELLSSLNITDDHSNLSSQVTTPDSGVASDEASLQ